MRSHEVAQLPLHLNRPGGAARTVVAGRERMHSGGDRAGRILQPDCGRDCIGPVPGDGTTLRQCPHAVGFIAEFPVADRPALLQLMDKAADEADLPLDRTGIRNRIEPVERGRDKETSAHPAGDKADHKFKLVLLGDGAEGAETAKHLLVDSGPAAAGRRQFSPVHQDRAGCIAASDAPFNRLKLLPDGEDPQQPAADGRQPFKIAPDHRFIPLRPHAGSRMRRPVIATNFHHAVGPVCFSFTRCRILQSKSPTSPV